MNIEPRYQEDYGSRQVEAAHRVLVDLGQVLASFADCFVVIGGWIPDLLLDTTQTEPHIGSIDVDLALDINKLSGERYAQLLQSLLSTRRYRQGEKDFQLVVEVDLEDGEKPVQVEVEFLAPMGQKMKKHRPKLIEGFRVLETEACEAAFHAPQTLPLQGKTVRVKIQIFCIALAFVATGCSLSPLKVSDRSRRFPEYPITTRRANGTTCP